jgi:hypothetical protein
VTMSYVPLENENEVGRVGRISFGIRKPGVGGGLSEHHWRAGGQLRQDSS